MLCLGRKLFLLGLFLLVFVVPAWAGSLSLAVYGEGRVLVCEVRSMNLPKAGEVVFTGVAETVQPDTLSVRSLTAPKAFKLLETAYRFDRADAATLLERFVGREVTVILPDPSDADGRVSRKAVLLHAGSRPVFDLGGKIYVGPYEGVLLPELPSGLDRVPVLRWKVANSGPSRQDIEVSYLASGVAWRAAYSLNLERKGKQAALSTWATIDNHSGTAFDDATVKLVVGEVNQAPAPRRAFKGAVMEQSMDMDDGPRLRGVGEYYLYQLPERISLGRGESRQVRLFSAETISVETKLESRFNISAHQYGSDSIRQQVSSYLSFVNDSSSGLGKPMPAGVIRVYRQDGDGTALLVGEDRVGHVAKGSKVRLKLGTAFDLEVKRMQTAFRRTGKRSVSMTWEITVRNGSDSEKVLRLVEDFRGQWKISKATMKYERITSGAVGFDLVLPPGKGTTTLSYTVDIES